MADPFKEFPSVLDSPATTAEAVVPDTPLARVSRGLYVGGAGDVAVEMHGGQEVTFVGVPAGAILPIRVRLVKTTGTDATDMIALA